MDTVSYLTLFYLKKRQRFNLQKKDLRIIADSLSWSLSLRILNAFIIICQLQPSFVTESQCGYDHQHPASIKTNSLSHITRQTTVNNAILIHYPSRAMKNRLQRYVIVVQMFVHSICGHFARAQYQSSALKAGKYNITQEMVM